MVYVYEEADRRMPDIRMKGELLVWGEINGADSQPTPHFSHIP